MIQVSLEVLRTAVPLAGVPGIFREVQVREIAAGEGVARLSMVDGLLELRSGDVVLTIKLGDKLFLRF